LDNEFHGFLEHPENAKGDRGKFVNRCPAKIGGKLL